MHLHRQGSRRPRQPRRPGGDPRAPGATSDQARGGTNSPGVAGAIDVGGTEAAGAGSHEENTRTLILSCHGLTICKLYVFF